MSALNDLLEHFQELPEEKQKAALVHAKAVVGDRPWTPNPGPQTEAYFCEADELFYGGQAGGGKSALGVGLAMTTHRRSLILRRINKDAKKLAEAELIGKILDGDRSGWNGSDLVYRGDGRSVEFGGCEYEDDKQRYKGDPHDLIVFDEGPDFLESQYEFIIIWNRSSVDGQKCRVVMTGNPPTSAAGLWVVRRWAAWLDPQHPNPAKPGELRWYVRDDEDRELEVDGPGPHRVGDKYVYAKSRTFIPATLQDNPDLAADGEYERMLDSLPKSLRDAYRDGQFKTVLQDEPHQLIPSAWVQAAQDRWSKNPPKGIPMSAIGVDCAQGGGDNNILSPRHDGWFEELTKIPGRNTPVGTDLLGPIMATRRDRAKIIVDAGGGFGGATYKALLDNNIPCSVYKGAATALGRSRCGLYSFFNTRAKTYWRFREALDPSQPGGSRIALPPDTKLFADLTSILYTEEKDGTGLQIKLEPKEKLIKRTGASTDESDAVVMAWSDGDKMENSYEQWKPGMAGKKAPKVIMTNRRKRR
jgi:hypothetical protein